MLKRLTSNILYSFTFTRNRNYVKDSVELFNTYSQFILCLALCGTQKIEPCCLSYLVRQQL